jgi:hypothetical protein
MMTAGRTTPAFKLLMCEPNIDWTYERPCASTAARYSMLSESVLAGDAEGVYALSRLTDAQVTRSLDGMSAVMHRAVSSVLCPTRDFRLQTLEALRWREGIVWPATFVHDTIHGTLPTIATHGRTTPIAEAFWDAFSCPRAPWHQAFMAACDEIMPAKDWQHNDPLRAAGNQPALCCAPC